MDKIPSVKLFIFHFIKIKPTIDEQVDYKFVIYEEGFSFLVFGAKNNLHLNEFSKASKLMMRMKEDSND